MDNMELAGAWRLLGKPLKNGWTVTETLGWEPSSGTIPVLDGTGGNFSVPYIVEKDGHRAFLKAIDYTPALRKENRATILNKITKTYLFEAYLHEICKGAKMNRVVVALDSGEASVGPNIQDTAPYLIFELAEGDVRKRVQKKSGEIRLAWWLRAMHDATLGLSELHNMEIAHQDIKPSNILSFEGDNVFKVSDLGRSSHKGDLAPHDIHKFAGDPKYAPPEILYDHINPDEQERKLQCDLWMLGSMIFFFVRGFGATQLLLEAIEIDHRPISRGGKWNGNYSCALDHLQNGFTKIINDLETDLGNNQISIDLVKAAKELCNLNHKKRGHPLAHASLGNSYSLERYISLFDLLTNKANKKLKQSIN